MKLQRRPSAEQVLYVLDTMLCEYGCHVHLLDGDEMRAAWAFTHLAMVDCPNKHKQARKVFWERYKSLKKEGKNASRN